MGDRRAAAILAAGEGVGARDWFMLPLFDRIFEVGYGQDYTEYGLEYNLDAPAAGLGGAGTWIEMYRVYLVDDEALILSDMERSIPWYEHDFQLAGSSTDPRLALHEIFLLKPDAVFTDIKMPGMSGFELVRALREKELECEVVIVSAYEDFDYARQAIQLEGFDYLIKPVEATQFAQLLDRLRKRLERRYPHRNLPATQSAELNAIIQHLNAGLKEKSSLSQLAARFNISPNYICGLFSRHLGTTYSAYLTKIRMELAARLLSTTDKPVKEIAMESGYDDYFYFCRVFREFHSVTPTRYRQGR